MTKKMQKQIQTHHKSDCKDTENEQKRKENVHKKTH